MEKDYFIAELNGEVSRSAFNKLPESERIILLRLANDVISKVKRKERKGSIVPPIGVTMALELFAKLGIFLNQKEKENN